MHLTTIFRRYLLAGVTGVAGIAALAGIGPREAAAQQPKPPATAPAAGGLDARIGKLGEVVVPVGGLAKFDPKTDKVITDIELSNGDVVDARPIAPDLKRIDLVGKLGGAAKMTVTFGDRSKAVYTVVVQPDYEQLRLVLRQTVPTANVEVIPGVGNVIILSGTVDRPEDADTVVRIASSAVGGQTGNVINAIQAGGSQHVMIDVTVAQVDRSEIRERGFSFGAIGTTATFTSVLGGLATGGGTFTSGANANIVSTVVPAGFTGALRALRTEGLAKFLSEPKITTMSGRPAFFRAGGQQATLSPSSGINGPGVTFVPVGTELEVLPIVRGDGRIHLEINPRISSVNNARGITTAFGFTPGFNEQQTRSVVTLEPGQTFAIGGLLETTVQANAQKVPYLGDLPLVGTAFSSVSHTETETELLILVTPRLVEPLDCTQVPKRVPGKESRSADDYELFVESLIEAPRGQRQAWNGLKYTAAWKCGPTGYPCRGNVCNGGGCGAGGLTTGIGGSCATCQTGAAPVVAPAVPVSRAGMSPAALAVSPATADPVPVSPVNGSEPNPFPPAVAPAPIPVRPTGGIGER